MNPFEFIIIFLAFVYSLALTHLLFAWTRMIRLISVIAYAVLFYPVLAK
jgi:hypothetical protein